MILYGLLLFFSLSCCQVSADYQAELEKRGECPMHYVTGPNDVCYRFSEDYKSFTQAQKQCETEGAHLVNTQSQVVYRFVKQHIEANPKRPKIAWVFGKVSKIFTKWHRGYWIGARRHGGRAGAFRWLNGKPLFGHWLSGMPDNGRLFLINWINEDCVQQLESWHGWNDAECSTQLRYICQKTASNPCAEVNCGGKGKCFVRNKKAVCRCTDGWTGMRCRSKVDVCAPNPCVNGGECFSNSVGVHCKCSGQFSGRRCEKKCRFVVTSEGLPEKADVMILLDGSTSVLAPDYDKSLAFVAKFVDKMKLGADSGRVGLIQFSHQHHEEFSFADSVKLGKALLKRKIMSLKQLTGGTATGRVLEFAKNIFHRSSRLYSLDAAKYIIVLTDGQSHQENIIRTVVPLVLKMNVKILAIGIGSAVDEAELLLLTGGHKERMFSVNSFDQLNQDFLLKIIEKMCD